MNFNLLSQNLLLYVAIINALLAYYIVTMLYKPVLGKKKPGKKARRLHAKLTRQLFGMVVISVGLIAFFFYNLVGNLTETSLPKSFILMSIPFSFFVCFFVYALLIKKQLVLISCLAVVLGLGFSLLLINDYYRYNPTIGSVFGKTDALHYKGSLNSVTLRYNVATNQSTYNTDSIQSSLTSVGSGPTAGQLYQLSIPGTVSHFQARDGYVYVPAIYTTAPSVSLPVIVLTAGVPGRSSDWVSLGVQSIMDQFAKTHDGITPIVFMVDSLGSIGNDTECVNSPRGNAETYLTTDVPNYIKAHFRVQDSPKNWAIGGLSLGGMCSIMLTLRHPDVFHYFIDLGGEIGPEVGTKEQTIAALFGGSEKDWEAHQPAMLLVNGNPDYKQLGGFFGDGNQDTNSVTQAISQLTLLSKKDGINSVSETINGAHTFNVWAQTYSDALPWISNRIGATQCSSSCL